MVLLKGKCGIWLGFEVSRVSRGHGSLFGLFFPTFPPLILSCPASAYAAPVRTLLALPLALALPPVLIAPYPPPLHPCPHRPYAHLHRHLSLPTSLLVPIVFCGLYVLGVPVSLLVPLESPHALRH